MCMMWFVKRAKCKCMVSFVLLEVIGEARNLTRAESVVQNAQVAIVLTGCAVSITQVAKISRLYTRLAQD